MTTNTPIENTIYQNAFASAYEKCQRGGMDNRASVNAAELAGEQAVESYRAKNRLLNMARLTEE